MEHTISDHQIEEILQSAISENEWEYRLGVAINKAVIGRIDHFDFDPEKFGRHMWRLFKGDLYSYFCHDSKPREWLADIITGDIRNTVIGIVLAITTKYEVTLAIAIPICALVLKTGVLNYCASKQVNVDVDLLFSSYLKAIKRGSKKNAKKSKKGKGKKSK